MEKEEEGTNQADSLVRSIQVDSATPYSNRCGCESKPPGTRDKLKARERNRLNIPEMSFSATMDGERKKDCVDLVVVILDKEAVHIN
jgi:hypothetical protein